jgi:hypothetical protein
MGAKKTMGGTAMGHARSMRDPGEPCNEWFLEASMGFRGCVKLREPQRVKEGYGRLLEAAGSLRELRGVLEGKQELLGTIC